MIDKRNIEKIVIGIMLAVVIAVLVVLGIWGTQASISRDGIAMQYESELFGDDIIDINIRMDEDQWKELLETATSEEYYSADVIINGKTYSEAGVRAKGNTSLSQVASSGSDRFSLKIKFDEYVDGQNCYGLSKLILNNNYCDATMMKEAICYDMFRYLNADSSLYNYAKVSVNGEYIGLYLALEPVEESFCERIYGTSFGKLYKPDSMEMGGGRGNMKDFDMDKFNEKFDPDEEQQADDSDAQKSGEDDRADMMQRGEPPEMPEGDQQNGERPERPGNMQGGEPPEMPGGGDFGGNQQGGEPPEMPNGEQPGGQQNADESGEQPGGQQNADGSGKQPGGPGEERNTNGSDLNYTNDDTESYSTIWDGAVFNCTAADKSRLIKALKNLCAEGASYDELSQYIDMENMARYMAVHSFVVNLDSLSGNMAHNYYLYEKNGMLNMIPWDYNLAFGGFQSGNASAVINFSISWPFSNMSEEDRQLFANLLNCDEFKNMYYANLKKLASKYVLGGQFEKKVSSLRDKIDDLVEADPTAFYSYGEYKSAQKMLSKVVTLRAQSVLAQLDKDGATVDVDGIDISVMGAQGGGQRPSDRDEQ